MRATPTRGALGAKAKGAGVLCKTPAPFALYEFTPGLYEFKSGLA